MHLLSPLHLLITTVHLAARAEHLYDTAEHNREHREDAREEAPLCRRPGSRRIVEHAPKVLPAFDLVFLVLVVVEPHCLAISLGRLSLGGLLLEVLRGPFLGFASVFQLSSPSC